MSAGKDITDANREPRGAHMQYVVCKYTYPPILPSPYYQSPILIIYISNIFLSAFILLIFFSKPRRIYAL